MAGGIGATKVAHYKRQPTTAKMFARAPRFFPAHPLGKWLLVIGY